jgi:serine/threonine protein kinase
LIGFQHILFLTFHALLFRGYTAPEYAIKGELSEKADIYSFGVLVLEIISSRKNTDLSLPSEMQYLPEYVHAITFPQYPFSSEHFNIFIQTFFY